jgi:hypothetical protein
MRISPALAYFLGFGVPFRSKYNRRRPVELNSESGQRKAQVGILPVNNPGKYLMFLLCPSLSPDQEPRRARQDDWRSMPRRQRSFTEVLSMMAAPTSGRAEGSDGWPSAERVQWTKTIPIRLLSGIDLPSDGDGRLVSAQKSLVS